MIASVSLLEVRDLARSSRSGTLLLSPASFSIHAGDWIVCQGNSGAGKTVLLRALAMLDETQGDISWPGRVVAKQEVPSFRSKVIYLQQNQLLPEGSVREALQEPLSWAVNQDIRYDESRVLGWLERLGRNSSFVDAKTSDLSGGESQIVALVRALQLDPTILLLDEPTSALDDATATQVEQLIQSWISEDARAAVWVTHNQQQADRIATRRFQIDAGRLTVDA